MERYTNRGPVTCDEGFDTSNVKGKSVVITGGANGIGEQYVRNLVKAGAYVTFGDVDEKGGKKVESDMRGSAKMVKCDVMNWDEQLAMFKDAIANSPKKRIDVVVANAGIAATPDDVYTTDVEKDDPEKPQMKTWGVNTIGAFVSLTYTIKLALHYFRRQFAQDPDLSKDQLLVLQSSVAGYFDIPTSIQYGGSKWVMRSAMRGLRWSETAYGIRVNNICPWFIDTAIMSKDTLAYLESNGVEYATTQDAAQALLKLASDPSINGRAFGIFPRGQVKSGYADLDTDDYTDSDPLKFWDDELAKNLKRSPG